MDPKLLTPEQAQLLTTAEVGKMLGKTPETLNQMRHQGTGPTYVKLGARSIRYMRQDVMDYMWARRMVSPNEPAAKVSA